MDQKYERFDNGKVIHVASGSKYSSKVYAKQRAEKFDKNNRVLKEALLNEKNQETRVSF